MKRLQEAADLIYDVLEDEDDLDNKTHDELYKMMRRLADLSEDEDE